MPLNCGDFALKTAVNIFTDPHIFQDIFTDIFVSEHNSDSSVDTTWVPNGKKKRSKSKIKIKAIS